MTDRNYGPVDPDFLPVRAPVAIAVGAFVQYDDTVYRIEQLLDFNTVIGTAIDSGRSKQLRIPDLRSPDDDESALSVDLPAIADDDWRIAESRYAAIKQFVGRPAVGRNEMDARAKEVGRDTATLYRWLKLYRVRGMKSDLIPRKRGWQAGVSKLSPAADKIIEETIEDFFLTPAHPRIVETVTEVHLRCDALGIEAPSATAVRRRIARVSQKVKLKRRGFRNQASKLFDPSPGHIPHADCPLDIVQIDHTPVDIEIVDDLERRPIGRPFITIALDVCTSMVTGYYLSLDEPSAASVGLCIAHAALPKEDWLKLHEVDAEWPTWGFPRTVHADNGSDLRSSSVMRSCSQRGIHLEYRPLGNPKYGGSVESGLRSLLMEIHSLPGSTFSSVDKKGEYDSAKNAAMTLSELEGYIVEWLTTVYHHRPNTRDRKSPLRKWKIGFLGDADNPPRPMPTRPTDRLGVMLDFLPIVERTIQPIGVAIDGLTYYDEVLRDWIGAKDEASGKTREFVFRRDPRDISEIYFLDPKHKRYTTIPSADLALPAISLWEHRIVQKMLRDEGHANDDGPARLRAIRRLRERKDESVATTRKARRTQQRRKEHEKKTSPAAPLPVSPTRSPVADEPIDDMVDGPVGTFEELS